MLGIQIVSVLYFIFQFLYVTCHPLWWVDPGQQLSPHSGACSLLPPAAEQGREKEGQKWEKCVGQDKGSFIMEWKKKKAANQTSDAKAITHHLPQHAQPVPEQQLLWNDYWPPPKFLLLSEMLYGMEHPFGQFRSAVPAVSPPNRVSTPSLHSRVAEWETESLDAVQSPLAIAKTLVRFTHRCKEQHHRGCYEER